MTTGLKPAIEISRDKSRPMDDRLIEPSYNDPRFRQGEHTIFLAPGSFLTFLQRVLESKDLQLVHIKTGVNHATGAPVRVLGYLSAPETV